MPAPKDPIKYQEWKDNLSKSHKGNPKCHPDGWSEKVSAKLTGRERTQSHCDNISKSKTGKKQKPRSKSHCENLSKALKNKPKSELHKKHLSESKKHLSDDARKNISIAAKKRFEDEEYYNNHCISRIGVVHQEYTRIKMIESHIGGFWYGNVRYYDNQYCEKWTSSLRERVRAYFNYTCFECGIKQTDRKHSVHHVHYNKKTCCDGSPHDLVPLCPECHTKTNYNRDYWEDHFTERLYENNPDGKCFFTRDEMREFTQSLKGIRSVPQLSALSQSV